MKPLQRVLPWVVPEGWGYVTAGLAGLVLAVAFPNPEYAGVVEILIYYVLASAFAFLIRRLWALPRVDTAMPAPVDVTVGPSKGPLTHWVLTAGGSLAFLILVSSLGFDLDLDLSVSPPIAGLSLGFGFSYLSWGRNMARWETEHGVEVLGPRGPSGNKWLCVRPRTAQPPTGSSLSPEGRS